MKTPEEKKKLLHRLKRAEGQIRGIQKMIEEEQSCVDVVTQLSAVRSGIDRVMGMVVAENLMECLENPSLDTEQQEAKLQEAIHLIIKK